MQKLIIIFCACIVFGGCAALQLNDPIVLNEINNLPFKKYTYNYSMSTSRGILYIIAQPSSMEILSDQYHFLIAHQNIHMFKSSIAQLTLDVGHYTLQGVDGVFNRMDSFNVEINPAIPTCVIYRGPSDMIEQGKFFEVPCSNGAIKYAFTRPATAD